MKYSNQMLNEDNRKYFEKCINSIVNMGIDFKLQNQFRKEHISKEKAEKAAKIKELKLLASEKAREEQKGKSLEEINKMIQELES